MTARTGTLLLLLTVTVQGAPAQSLGDVARREADRRERVADGRLYTNADLERVSTSAQPPTSSPAEVATESASGAGTASSDGAPVPAQAAQAAEGDVDEPVIVKAREKRDEAYWRALNKELRGRLAKATSSVAQWTARLAEIEAGPQTPTLVREREVISASLTRLRRDARSHSEELTRFLTRAQMANVKEEWIR